MVTYNKKGRLSTKERRPPISYQQFCLVISTGTATAEVATAKATETAA
jgi:hypothetical protein